MDKVLTYDAQSAHGGKMDWTPYLPKWVWDDFDACTGHWQPGGWVSIPDDQPLSWCQRGLHLTCDPLRWMIKKGRVFLAEYRGEWVQNQTTDKCCFRSVRLLAELGLDSLDLSVKLFKMINSGVYLRGAYLRGAYLRDVHLRDADLRDAYLRGAYLQDAYLQGADLRGEKLTKEPLMITGLRYFVIIAVEKIHIGCEVHKAEEWAKFKDSTIEAMNTGALEWWKTLKPAIMALHAEHAKP